MKVEPKTKIRVRALMQSVYTGLDGDIIVCDPDGVDPMARYPRIMAQDLAVGIRLGAISTDVDKAKMTKSDQMGNTHENKYQAEEARIAAIDLDELAAMEREMSGQDLTLGDAIARPAGQGGEVSIGTALLDDDLEKDDEVVTMVHKGGGVFVISAPWLAEPLEVKGKVDAEAEKQRIADEGPPPIQ
jgi:hypothetical protein